jgi:TolA-binding protein
MKRHSIGILVGLAMALLSPVPSSAQDRETRQLMADVRMLQQQAQQLQLALGALGAALKAVSSKLDDQAAVTRKAFADERLLVDGVMSEARIVREKIDETNVRISTLSQEMEALRAAIPTQPAPGTVALMPGEEPAAPADPSAAAAAPPTAPPSVAGLSPQRTYDQAHADYAAGSWTLAIAGFDTYIKTFPKSELADDAQFYIGESYSLDGKFAEAVEAYDKVIANYPNSDLVPDALY